MERIPSCRFLGTHIFQELSRSTNTAAITKKAQQPLHFLRILRKNYPEQKLLVSFYRSATNSVLTVYITAWSAGRWAADRRALQRVIGTAQKITGCPLPSLEELAHSRCTNRTRSILKDPAHHLFNHSGGRDRSMKSGTSRLTNSFYPWAIHTLNKQQPLCITLQNHMNNHLYLWTFFMMLTFLDLLLLFRHMWAGGLLSGRKGRVSDT